MTWTTVLRTEEYETLLNPTWVTQPLYSGWSCLFLARSRWIERGRERGGSLAPFPIHRPAQLRRVGGYCNFLHQRRDRGESGFRGVLLSWHHPFLGAMGSSEIWSSVQWSPMLISSWEQCWGKLCKAAASSLGSAQGSFGCNFLISCVPEQHRRESGELGTTKRVETH